MRKSTHRFAEDLRGHAKLVREHDEGTFDHLSHSLIAEYMDAAADRLDEQYRTIAQTKEQLAQEVNEKVILQGRVKTLANELQIARAQVKEARRAAQDEAREQDRLRRKYEWDRDALLKWVENRMGGGI